MDAGDRARRSFAAFALRMISGYVLYRDSAVKSQREVARICQHWIVTRGKRTRGGKKALTFDFVFEEVLDIDPEAMRLRIKQLRREDFLRKAQTCVEQEEAVARACREAEERANADVG